MMTTALVPFVPSSCRMPGTVSAGVMTTARSGGARHFRQRLQDGTAGDFAALAVDQMDFAREAAVEQIARDGRADRAGAVELAPMATMDFGAINLSRLRVDIDPFHRRRL